MRNNIINIDIAGVQLPKRPDHGDTLHLISEIFYAFRHDGVGYTYEDNGVYGVVSIIYLGGKWIPITLSEESYKALGVNMQDAAEDNSRAEYWIKNVSNYVSWSEKTGYYLELKLGNEIRKFDWPGPSIDLNAIANLASFLTGEDFMIKE